MQTTFILHGGYVARESEYNDQFFASFTQFVHRDTVRIVLCYFAREQNEWENLYIRDTAFIKKQTSKSVITTLARNPHDLLEKLATFDVLYIAGGEAENIEPFLPELENLKKLIVNKVYIGSSMGAFIVAKNYILSFPKQEDNSVHKGLGILPMSVLCHWNIEKNAQEKLQKLKTYDPNTPILQLDEEKYAVFSY